MNEKIEHLLNEYVDGTLDEAMSAEVEEILAQSAEARAYLADLQALFGSLDALDEQPVPLDFAPQVMAKVGKTAVSRWADYWLIIQLIGASVLFILAWPILQSTIFATGPMIEAWATTLPVLTLPNLWETLRQWITAVSKPTPVLSTFDLNAIQQIALLIGAFCIWLLSNSYFLMNQSE